MLAPETRTLLSDALRPPEGFSLDVAVATTYSLDLTTLLLAPLSFALFDYESDQGPDGVNPLQLLESVSRYAEKVSVFVQAGAISVPASQSHRLFPFIEDSVIEVGVAGGLFHPKVWALRFMDGQGSTSHRLLVMSRNLTFDNSWDTVLQLEEAPVGAPRNGAPVAEFINSLHSLALTTPNQERIAAVESLVSSLRSASFVPPSPFTSLEFLAFGPTAQPWPFPTTSDRILAITPFASRSMLTKLGEGATHKQLVSRERTLEELGAKAVFGWSTHVLDPATEADNDETAESVVEVPISGLHAKTYVFDHGSTATVVTGSVNLTAAALEKNFEFAVSMIGPVSTCGTSAILDGTKEAPGFAAMLARHEVQSVEGETDGISDLEWQIEAFHQQLAASGLTMRVSQIDDQLATVTLTIDGFTQSVGASTVRPLSVGNPHPLEAEELTWQLARVNVTPFVVVETTLAKGELSATRRCVLKAQLTGDVGDRRRDAMSSILKNREDVIRFLLFLLGDPRFVDAPTGDGTSVDAFFGGAAGGSWDNLALLEPLMRAVGRDGDALVRVKSLMDHLDATPEGDELLPPDLTALWDVLWLVHLERTAR